MRLFTLFTRQAPNRVFVSILLSVVAGLGNALLIPILLTSVGRDVSETALAQESRVVFGLQVAHFEFALLFIITCALVLMARSTSRVMLKRIILEAAAELRIKTCRSIMRTPIAELEKLGPSRLLATITVDVNRVASGARNAPDIVVSVITLVGMSIYLLLLNVHVFYFVLAATLVGALTYQIPAAIGRKHFERARARYDELHESIRGLIFGAKELRLNRRKRDRYFDEVVLVNEHGTLGHEKRAHTIITLAAAYGELLGFLLIGATAFVFVNYHQMNQSDVLAVMMVLLYIVGPMAAILNTIPNLASARVSLQNMQQVLSKLSEEQDGDDINPLEHWRTMRLAGVSYHYSTVDGRIEIGPVDLELARGEITFLVGGNGSGKSSLCKLISLHYSPDAGEIYVGKTRVDPLSRNSCRQAIAAVMTDYYLFDRLLMDMNPETERLVQQLLIELGLAHVLSIEGGRFSRTALSDGQRKRLALLCALLEDRDLYVFDEWADNQDPSFKNIFYLQILPALRARNKAIVVVSHDDRYFNVADQLIVMEGGKCIRKERCVPRDGRQSPQPGATAIVVGAGWRQPAAHSVSKLP